MATPPTVLANTSSSPPPSPVAPAGFPVAPLLIAVLVGVIVALLGVGGAVWYLARTGRLPGGKAAVAAKAPASLPTHVIVLDPLLVNLADAGGNAYLRISVALRVADVAGKSAAKKEDKPDTAAGGEQAIAVRDTALMVLGRQTSDVLLAADGKERLKDQLKAAFAEHNPQIKVQDIFFTDFLVQR